MKEFLVLCLIALGILAVVFGPLAIIWAINTLFTLTIPFTFKTWLAALLLAGAFGRATVTVKH